jgi:hypothetical protein
LQAHAERCRPREFSEVDRDVGQAAAARVAEQEIADLPLRPRHADEAITIQIAAGEIAGDHPAILEAGLAECVGGGMGRHGDRHQTEAGNGEQSIEQIFHVFFPGN